MIYQGGHNRGPGETGGVMGETYGDVVVEEFWSEDFTGAVEDTRC